jgi:hypothetical protein
MPAFVKITGVVNMQSHNPFGNVENNNVQIQPSDQNQSITISGVPVNPVSLFNQINRINMPGGILIHNVNSESTDNSTGTKQIDDHTSCVNKTGIISPGSLINVGANADGLPYTIVVKGIRDDTGRGVSAFIETEVTPLLEQCSNELSKHTSHIERQAIIENLISDIYRRRFAYGDQDIRFTMSVAINYQQGDTLRRAGFSIGGGTGLIVRNAVTGEIRQLATENFIHDETRNKNYCDMFAPVDVGQINNVGEILNIVERNCIFDELTQEGDEISGYTSIVDEDNIDQVLVAHTADFGDNYQIPCEDLSDNTNPNVRTNQAKIRQCSLNFASLDFDNNNAIFDNFNNNNKINNCLFSSVKVPTFQMQCNLKKIVFEYERRKLLDYAASYDGQKFIQNGKMQVAVRDLIAVIDAIPQTDANITALIRDMAACNLALQKKDHDSVMNLFIRSKDASGKTRGWQIGLGAAMMAVGLLVAAAGGLVLAISMAALIIPPLTIPAAVGIPTGYSLIAAGVGLFAAGIPTCHYGRQRGESKIMEEIGKDVNNDTMNNAFGI